MKFVSVRDLNTKPREVWDKVKENDVIVTSNGKPVAILTNVDEKSLERKLRALRRSRALLAVEDMQKTASERGLSDWTDARLEKEISGARRSRRS